MKAMEDYKPSILLNTIKAKQIMHSIPVNMQVRVQSIRYAKELFIESFRGNKGGWSQQIISDGGDSRNSTSLIGQDPSAGNYSRHLGSSANTIGPIAGNKHHH
jgi:hypothetical protein